MLSPQSVGFLDFVGHLPTPPRVPASASTSASPQVPTSASTLAFPGCPPRLPLWPSPGACFGFHFGFARVLASKLGPPPVSFLAFAAQLPALQWLQVDGSGGVKIGVEISPRASFQLSFQPPLGARFSFHFGIPWVPALASTVTSPSCPLQL